MKFFEFTKVGFHDRRDIMGLFDTYSRPHAPNYLERESHFTNRLVRRALRHERWSATRKFLWRLLRGTARMCVAPLGRRVAPWWSWLQTQARLIVNKEIRYEGPLPEIEGINRDFTPALRCPNCGQARSFSVIYDSRVCDDCGFRWDL